MEVVKAEYDSNIPLHDKLEMYARFYIHSAKCNTIHDQCLKCNFFVLHFSLTPWIQRTLFKQITNWVVFGNLNDPNFEFFIQRCRDDIETLSSPSISTPVSKHKQVSKSKAEKLYVNYSIVPSHFSVPLVERILFLGDSVRILEKSESKLFAVFKPMDMRI